MTMATKRKETNAEIGKRLSEAKKAAKAKRDAIAKGTRHFEVYPILSKYPRARYYYLLGGRGCGKTYPVIQHCIDEYFDGKGVFAYIRRHKESITGKNMIDLFSPHNDYIFERSGHKWNRISYWRGRFYLELWEYNPETGIIERTAKNPEPIGGAWSMSTWETDKGADFGADKGGISNIIFDEVLSKAGQYLYDEWSIMQNVIASLVRDRWEQDTKIWMLANPVSKWANPYFRNMGIGKNLIKQPGITEIKYPDETGKKTAMSAIFVYIAAKTDKNGNVIEIDQNRTNVYNTFFAFGNSKGKSKAITHGFWEMDDSSRLPKGIYAESTKNRTVYCIFEEEKLAIDIMKYDYQNKYYLMIYPTDKIRDKTYFMVLGTSLSKYAIVGKDNSHPITQLIMKIYDTGQVYYSDDSTADAFHGFLIERNRYKI